MPAIGTGVSTAKGSGSRSWTPLKPLGGETPSAWYNSRSGLSLVDSLGGAALPIQLPYLYKPTGDEYAYVADNGALDIVNNLGVNPISGGNTGFTLVTRVKGETASNPATAFTYAGKYTSTSVNGRYGISCFANSKISAYCQPSGGIKGVEGTTVMTDQAVHLVIMEIDDTDKVVRLFVDNLQEGASTSYTGTFSALAAAYEFNIGTANGNAGTGVQWTSKTSHGDTYVFPFILTAAEKTTLFNYGYVAGAKAHWDCVLREDNKIIDLSNNGYHLTGVNLLKSTKTKYGSIGSRQGLDKGYTRFIDFPNKDIFVPHLTDGTALSAFATPTGYTKDADYNGSAVLHNGYDSYITLTGEDRSGTTIYSYLARATNLQHYYDSNNKSWFHINELYNHELSNNFNDDYRGLRFSKFANRSLTDLIKYTTNKTGSDYEKPIKWSAEGGILKFDVVVGPHICAVNGAKVLKFDDITGVMSLSYDSGATYPVTIATTLTNVDCAFINDDGKIGFADSTKFYYSHDNLASYHESTVTGSDGNPFVAGTIENFRPWSRDFSEVTHNGVKLRTWGAYITGGTAETVNINQWESTDGFLTVKSVYKFNSSLPNALARHIHDIHYDSYGDKFYMCTGDSDASNKNNLMQGVRAADTGIWTWTILGVGAAGTVWENTGIGSDSNYLYLLNEGGTASLNGIRRSLKSDIANIATNQETLFQGDTMAVYFRKHEDVYIMCQGGASGSDRITFSFDGQKFFSRKRTELTVLNAWGAYGCIGKLSNGYYVFKCIEQGETLDNYDKGSTLLIKPSIIV